MLLWQRILLMHIYMDATHECTLIIKAGQMGQFWQFSGCFTADSQTDESQNQLYNNQKITERPVSSALLMIDTISGERRGFRRAEQEPIMHGHHLPRDVHRLYVWNGEFCHLK